jgi:hypothetical protein
VHPKAVEARFLGRRRFGESMCMTLMSGPGFWVSRNLHSVLNRMQIKSSLRINHFSGNEANQFNRDAWLVDTNIGGKVWTQDSRVSAGSACDEADCDMRFGRQFDCSANMPATGTDITLRTDLDCRWQRLKNEQSSPWFAMKATAWSCSEAGATRTIKRLLSSSQGSCDPAAPFDPAPQ